MYLLHAPIERFGLIPPNTPLITDEVKFTNNYAFTHKYYWKKIHCGKGCLDISPSNFKKLRKKRDYKTVVFLVKGGIGDCLWSMPVIRMFREKFPKCYIHVVADDKTKLLWKNCQFINAYGIDLFWNTTSILRKAENIFEFSGIATIYKNLMKREPVEATFIEMDWNIPKEKNKMRPDLTLTVDEGENTKKFLKEKNIDIEKDKIVTIGIDASTSNRHYPLDYIKEVSSALVEKNIKVIWLGKTTEYRNDLLSPIDKIPGVCNLVATTNLREVMSIISFSDLHINPNSGLMVISTALGIPTIGLFGAFEPKIRCKYYEKFTALYHKLKCSPCNEHWTECRHGHPAPCMKSILPEELYKETIEMMEKYPRQPIEKIPMK